MTVMQVTLSIIALLVLIGLWAAQRSKHGFDIRDCLMDPATGKASLNAVVLALMAAVSIWVLIDRENDGREDVGAILNVVLGIFVLGRVAAQGITAFKPTDPPPAMERKTTTTETETVSVPQPPVAAPSPPPPIVGGPAPKVKR